jgi:hypothetical protein
MSRPLPRLGIMIQRMREAKAIIRIKLTPIRVRTIAIVPVR